MNCKICSLENNRKKKSDYCSRRCYQIDHKESIIEAIKKYNIKHPGRVKKISDLWYQNNKEKHKAAANRRRIENPKYMNRWHELNPGYAREYLKEWHNKNPEYMFNYDKNPVNRERSNKLGRLRYKNNLNYKIAKILRARILDAINRGHKSAHTMELIGCSIEYFVHHIESLWMDGMSWENHGTEWEIDHINQINWFDLNDEKQQFICFNYENQRPLWKTSDIANKYGYDSIVGNRNRPKVKELIIITELN